MLALHLSRTMPLASHLAFTSSFDMPCSSIGCGPVHKSRAFPGGIESGGFPTAFAQANLEKLIRLGARSMPKPYSTDLREVRLKRLKAERRGGRSPRYLRWGSVP